MYTTTQLLLLLLAMKGAGGSAPPHVQGRRVVAPTAAVSVFAPAYRRSAVDKLRLMRGQWIVEQPHAIGCAKGEAQLYR